MDDTASVITDVTDAQVEMVDVNLDLIESWNELELREAQVYSKHAQPCAMLYCLLNRSPDF